MKLSILLVTTLLFWFPGVPDNCHAQADPGEVIDLAIHEGPNTDTSGDLTTEMRVRASLVVFHSEDAEGTLSWEVHRSDTRRIFVLEFHTGSAECLDGQVVGIDFEGLLREVGGAAGERELVSGSVRPSTTVPDCLIWDIVDGNVHMETEGSILIVSNPCSVE